jgi:hypothetical protein
VVAYPVSHVKGWLDAVAVLGHLVKDRQALGHNRRVAQLCVQIGREMAMTTAELRVLAGRASCTMSARAAYLTGS